MEKINSFIFSTSQQIVFKSGAVNDLNDILPKLGSRVCLISGRTFAIDNPIVKVLDGLKLPYIKYVVSGEPTPDMVKAGLEAVREFSADVVIGIGGGSVLDTAKTIAMLAANGGDVMDYVEVVGKGFPINKRSIPFVAVPTTAGTGSEVTRNAVINLPEFGVKASLRSDLMFPTVALIDPDLTISLPKDVSAYTGLDAITQVVEPYLSIRSNHLIDTLCLDAFRIGYRALPDVYKDPTNSEARMEMSYVSLIGGIALTNAGLGAVHGFAASIGGMFDIPHGVICGSLLAPVMEANWSIVRDSAEYQNIQVKFYHLAKQAGFMGPEAVDLLIESLFEMRKSFNVRSLGSFGVSLDRIEEIVTKTEKASSMKGNPVKMPTETLVRILQQNI